ncbi:uncharacterized protein LOC135832693 [Planococcus citri]|uniref:uncharacterized protein LOC135832693 n=1 Tax=Planococcus citri TaxID=170843 RepID=UPI0031F751C2
MNIAGDGIRPGSSGLCANNPRNDAPPRGEQHEDNSRNNNGQDERIRRDDRVNDPNHQNDAAAESQCCNQCGRWCREVICCCIEHLRAPTKPPPANEDIDCCKLCIGGPRGYWLLGAVFIGLIWFWLIWTEGLAKFPVWDLKIFVCSNHSTYDLDKVSCIYPNETDFFTQERVDKFVNVLHSIILNEGCNDGLQDKFNIATKFHGQYPEIKNHTILNDLIRIHKFDIKNATKLIQLCKIHFRSSNRDLVHPVGDDGFLYMHDDLMTYCSYKSHWLSNVLISVLMSCLVHVIIGILRALGRNYKWPCKVISEIQQFCRVAQEANP